MHLKFELIAIYYTPRCIDEVEGIIKTCANLLEPVCKEDEHDLNDVVNTIDVQENVQTEIVKEKVNLQHCSPVNRWLCKITDEIE